MDIKERLPNETVLVKKISPKLVTQFKAWYAMQMEVRKQLYAITDEVYGRMIHEDERIESVTKVLRMVQIAYMHEKPFPKKIVSAITKYLITEQQANIAELTFWYDVNEKYKLWLKPRIAIRKSYKIVQIPQTAFDLAENGQTT